MVTAKRATKTDRILIRFGDKLRPVDGYRRGAWSATPCATLMCRCCGSGFVVTYVATGMTFPANFLPCGDVDFAISVAERLDREVDVALSVRKAVSGALAKERGESYDLDESEREFRWLVEAAIARELAGEPPHDRPPHPSSTRSDRMVTAEKETTFAEAADWCRRHNASVRFQSDGTVSVRINNTTRRRKTLSDAVEAVWAALVEGNP